MRKVIMPMQPDPGLLLGSETHTYVNRHSTDTPLLPRAPLLRVTGYKAAVC